MCDKLEIKSLDFGLCVLLSTFGQLASSLVFKNPKWSQIVENDKSTSQMCILEIKSLDFGSWALLSTFVQLTSSLVFKRPMWRPRWPPKWSKLQKISCNSREMSQNKTKGVTNWKYDNWDLVPGYCWSTFKLLFFF